MNEDLDFVDEFEAVKAQRVHHWTILGLAFAVVIGAFALEVCDNERVALRLWPAMPMPESCFSKKLFHVDCPGCGLTRSFIRLAEFDVAGSLAMHRLGWLLAATVLLQFPYRVWRLLQLCHASAPLPNFKGMRFVCFALVALLLLNWLIKTFLF